MLQVKEIYFFSFIRTETFYTSYCNFVLWILGSLFTYDIYVRSKDSVFYFYFMGKALYDPFSVLLSHQEIVGGRPPPNAIFHSDFYQPLS